uniref:Uncharacterized protein n=1 Tax=Clytia hemisphaerica TaxID=252671 RepID=A0A7M5UNE4_9CNID
PPQPHTQTVQNKEICRQDSLTSVRVNFEPQTNTFGTTKNQNIMHVKLFCLVFLMLAFVMTNRDRESSQSNKMVDGAPNPDPYHDEFMEDNEILHRKGIQIAASYRRRGEGGKK